MLRSCAEETMRTFLCIPIDARLRETLAELAGSLGRRVRAPASWVRPENFHVTIRFLGEIDPMLTVDLERLCREITDPIAPFDLTVDRLGAFPSPARPRVLWAGGEAPPEFLELTSSLNAALAKVGFPEERKETVAHITLARLKGPSGGSVEEAFRAALPFPAHTLRADRLVLMESALNPDGARYTPLFSRSLGGRGEV
jgi:2'-5' RNA ligase